MRLNTVLAFAALGWSNAFVPATTRKFGLSKSQTDARWASEPTACDIPTDVTTQSLVSEKGSAKVLRSAVLTNADGDSIRLGDQMGNGVSVVIFLRHLG